MTRTAQRTNDVMKVLALATVLLLPGSMIAGLLGMNVIVPLDKDSPMSFWVVVGGVTVLADLDFRRHRPHTPLVVAHARRPVASCATEVRGAERGARMRACDPR